MFSEQCFITHQPSLWLSSSKALKFFPQSIYFSFCQEYCVNIFHRFCLIWYIAHEVRPIGFILTLSILHLFVAYLFYAYGSTYKYLKYLAYLRYEYSSYISFLSILAIANSTSATLSQSLRIWWIWSLLHTLFIKLERSWKKLSI